MTEELEPITSDQRCQSCGMPLGEGFYGTLQGGTTMTEYCKFCFQEGNFTEPDVTVDDMMARSIGHMQRELNFSLAEAQKLAQGMIPELRRWKK